MAFLQLSPGRAVWGKARSLVLPCSTGGGEEIVLPANTTMPCLWLPRALTSISPGKCAGRWGSSAPLGAGGAVTGQGLLLASHGGCHFALNAAPRGGPGGVPRLQGTGGARRSPALLPETSQEYSPALQAGWYHRSLLHIRPTQGAAEQGHLQGPRTQSPALQSRGTCQQHGSPCHVQGQAAHQLPNPTASPHPIRGGRAPQSHGCPIPPPPAPELGAAGTGGDGQGTTTFPVHGSCSAA